MSTEPNTSTLTEKADAAFRRAAAAVIERARQTGTPVIIWENNRVTERSGEDLMRSPRRTRDNGEDRGLSEG